MPPGSGTPARREPAAYRSIAPYATQKGWLSANPHLPDPGVVGTYVHSYNSSHRFPYPAPIPAMRPSDDLPVRHRPSATPIYDTLYAEYRRSFKALPGDRSGEEDWEFTPFDALPSSVDWDRIAPWESTGAWQATGRRRRRNPPPALPPGSGGEPRHGL